jgi:hypothetical protein
MATAYFDYMTHMLGIECIEDYTNKEYQHYDSINKTCMDNRVELEMYYGTYNRKIFDTTGASICPVMLDKISIDNIINNDICNEHGVQLGHVIPKRDGEFSIRGKNVLMMTREGNRLLGGHKFTENIWLERLKLLLKSHYP